MSERSGQCQESTKCPIEASVITNIIPLSKFINIHSIMGLPKPDSDDFALLHGDAMPESKA